ncbi:MAG: hypothetical protein ACOYKA_07130 [Legionellaceae bacterium]
MISNRLVQVILLSACCSLTIPTWANTNAAEGGATFPGQDWKAPPKKNHAMPGLDAKKEGKLQPHKPSYPEPEFKPNVQPTPNSNYPEPQI